MITQRLQKWKAVGPSYFEIRVGSVPMNQPLAFDLYLVVSGRPVLFRKIGDVITPSRIENIEQHGGKVFLLSEDQRELYLQTLRRQIKDPGTMTELKGKFIKEAAFLALGDLFQKDEIAETIVQVTALVEEMVSLISSDIRAATSLMRLSTHDEYTYNHSVDVAVYSIALAKKIYGSDKDAIIAAGIGGFLHDVGKRKVSLKILNKPGKLDPPEWEEMKRHPTYGKQLVEHLKSVPEESKRVVYEHHENFNGGGYPCGIKGDSISKLACLVSIADVFDALTTQRPYADAMTPEEALKTMYGMAKGKFDPTFFKAFDRNFKIKSRLELPDSFDPCKE